MQSVHRHVHNKADILKYELARLIYQLHEDKTSVTGHVNNDVTDQVDNVLHSVLSFWKASQDSYPDNCVLNLADFVKVFYDPKEVK